MSKNDKRKHKRKTYGAEKIGWKECCECGALIDKKDAKCRYCGAEQKNKKAELFKRMNGIGKRVAEFVRGSIAVRYIIAILILVVVFMMLSSIVVSKDRSDGIQGEAVIESRIAD